MENGIYQLVIVLLYSVGKLFFYFLFFFSLMGKFLDHKENNLQRSGYPSKDIPPKQREEDPQLGQSQKQKNKQSIGQDYEQQHLHL